jgi:hypothetical protein
MLDRLQPEGDRRKAVGNQVDPENWTGSNGTGRASTEARNMTQISPELVVSR